MADVTREKKGWRNVIDVVLERDYLRSANAPVSFCN